MSVADIRRLPVTSTAIWDWRPRAACRVIDSDAFFHPEHERGIGRRQRKTQAKQVGSGCAVIDQCRRHALAVEEPYGVWGGLTEADRSDIVRARRAAARDPQDGVRPPTDL